MGWLPTFSLASVSAIKLHEGTRQRLWITDFAEVEGGNHYKQVIMAGRGFSRLTGDSCLVSLQQHEPEL